MFHATISGVPNDPPTADAGGPHVGTEDLPISGTALALDDPAVIEAVAKGTVTALTASPAITPADFKVAFVGDSGAGSNFRDVLQLIRDEGTDMVIHQGDLGYSSSASTWDQVITDVLGPAFPYFASKGNHDSWSAYRQVLSARMALVPGASCSGDPSDLGIQSSCTYEGLFFILSGAGEASGPIAHDTYIRQQLAQDNSTWSVCSWHKNQNAMQVGGKGNSTGWGVYEECRIGGAMVATAHEHSYSRTRTLTSTSSQTVDAEWPQAGETRLAEGSTVVFVSGLGGRSIRNQDRCSPSSFPYGCNGEWASIYTSDQGADYGALFCSFHVDGQPNKAHCYFKDVSGNVPDDFNITSFLGAGLGSPPVATPDSTTTNEDTPVDTDVLFNDSDPDPGDTLLLLGFDSASANGGVVTRLDNGTSGDTSDDDLRYTPAQDFNGVDSYSYDVSDGVYTSSAIVTVTVNPIEDPPVAVDDPDFTPIDTPVTTDVLANDSDPDGDTVLLQSFDPASLNGGSIALDDRGTGTASDDRLVYSPPSSIFEGVDSYSYTVSDGVLTDTATVTVTVANNLPPLAVDDPETTAINTAVTTDVLANDSEPEGDPFFLDSFDAVSTQGGTVSRDEGGTPGSTGDDQLVYTPPTDFVGVDTYGYTVADDKGGFASATVTVNVLAPDIVFERRVSTGNDDAEESSSGSVNLSSSDLELVQESSTQTIGIRFQNVGIPPEATVVSAWVQFQADESHSGGTSLTIAAQASANPATFSSSSGNVSSRPRLTETVSWSPPAWSTGSQGPAQQTPNLAPVIQAVVKQQNWTSGNSLVIIITGSGKRVAESYNGSSSAAALLHVEYATGPPPNTPPVVNAGGDQTIAQASVATTTLDATVTDDGLPAPPASVTTLWEQTGGPTDGASFVDDTAVDTTVTFSSIGTYTLRLTADDGEWQPLPFDEVTITVAVNQAPTVSVAAVPPVTLPSGAVLDGTVIDDGLPAPVITQWTGSGPGIVTFGNENAIDTTASFSTDGTYTLRLTATDVALGDYFAEVSITVNPAPPNWPPLAVDDPETTAINTAVTTDVLANDSDPEGDPLFLDSFDAVSTQGGTVSRDEGGTPGSTGDDQLVYTPPTDFVGVDTYGYRVSDDKGGFSTATVTVSVVAPDAIFERRVSTGNDDAEQSSSGSVNLSSSDLELVQESSTQTIGIRFQNVNVPPEATIVKAWVQFQADESDSGGTSLTFEAQASANPATFSSSSGNITSRPRLTESVSWSPPAWSTGGQGPAQQTPNLAPVIQQVVDQQNWTSGNSLVIIITGSGKRVAESYNGSSSAAALLHVEYATGPPPNIPPVVNAGGDQTIVQASVATATLDATVTDDGLPNPPASVTTLWEQTGGPTGGVATFTDANAIDTTVTFSISIFGTYTLRLTADDNEWQPFDEVMITVAVNQAPTVSVAAVPPVTLPSAAVLDGTVTDDGLPAPPGVVTTLWEQTGGPFNGASFVDANAIDTTVSFLTDGTYTLRLTADDSDRSDSAELTITVNPAPANQPPTVSVAAVPAVTLPAGAVLDGTVDDDGLPAPPGMVTTLWEQTGGPLNGASFDDATAVDTTASFSTDGEYVLRLTANDGVLTASATVTVMVNPAPENQPLTVSVAPVPLVTLPAGAVLDGTVDDDGLPAPPGVVTTLWEQTDGPTGGVATFTDANAVDTTASFSLAGTYVLSLTADDGEWQPLPFDEVTVEVLAPPPPPPGPQTIFFDDLQQSEPFTLWVESNEFDWTVKAPEEKQVPGSVSGNRVGHADNCDNGCFLTLAQTIDLAFYESATLSFWRYVDASLDSGEYLRVEISDGSAWTAIFEWTHGSGDDDQWHLESYDIPATHLVAGFSLRFVSRSSSSREDNEIDDVLLEGMPLIGGNRRPVADAGSNQTVTDEDGNGRETVTLDGSASSDPDGQIVDWEWAEGGSVLGNGETLDTDLLVGNYTVSLTVTDDGGATATDELLVRVFPSGGGDPTILEVRVSTGNDDAEEQASGSVGRSSSDLELVQESSTQTVGIRFQGLDIPPGATIVNAWLQFQADESHSGTTSLTIAAQASANPATFSSTSGSISSRPRLTETVSWSPPAWSTGGQGPAQQTPDLALVIQAVVNQQNWTSGNSLVIIITGSGKRVAESYNGSSGAAALLHVEYY